MWFCRESNSEQLLILNFMLKIRSYSSGNRRNFGKMSGFEKKYVVLKLELIFQFRFYSFFFRFRLPLRTFWTPYRAIFSIFCLTHLTERFYPPPATPLFWNVTGFPGVNLCMAKSFFTSKYVKIFWGLRPQTPVVFLNIILINVLHGKFISLWSDYLQAETLKLIFFVKSLMI